MPFPFFSKPSSSQSPAVALDQTSQFGSTGSSERPTQSTASSEIEEITDKVIRGTAPVGASCNGLPRESWDFAKREPGWDFANFEQQLLKLKDT